MEYVTVSGEDVPALGLGTWRLDGPDCRQIVAQAIELGYRHIDTAQAYGNEAEIGSALSAAAVDRSDLFITTKIADGEHAADRVLVSTRESLAKLGCSYLDLLLIHWPLELERLGETLAAMQRLRDDGLVRHVGVSNFTPSQVEAAMEHAPIFCNQVEYHPLLSQEALLDQARRHGFLLTAYSPIARGRVLEEEVVREVAAAHGKTGAQVVLRWLLDQEQVAAVVKTSTPERLVENLAVFDFSLRDDERRRIADLDRGERIVDAPWMSDWER